MPKKKDYSSLFTLRKDGRYQGYYTDKKGRHFVYDKDPEKLFYKLQEKKKEGEQEPGEVLFPDIAEAWQREHRDEITERSWKNYEPHYKQLLERYRTRQIESVTALDVSQHLAQAKAQGYSATVVNSIRSLYRMIFDYAIVHEHMKYNPVLAVKLPRGLKRGKRTAPTDAQMKIIFSSVERPFGLFPFLLLCTGMRKSEALALTWDDIDFGEKKINVTKSLDFLDGAHPKVKLPKTEAGRRSIPILNVLMEPLKEARAKSKSPYLFPEPPSPRGGPGGGYMTERAYEGAWNRYCKDVGLVDEQGKPTLTAHNLRHGTATLMFESDVDELSAKTILGHSRIEITREIYTDLRAAQEAKSVDKLNDSISELMSPASQSQKKH